MVSRISEFGSAISSVFSQLPRLNLSTAKVALLAAIRFIAAPAIFIAQRISSMVKPVSPQMAVVSAATWVTIILGIYLLCRNKPEPKPKDVRPPLPLEEAPLVAEPELPKATLKEKLAIVEDIFQKLQIAYLEYDKFLIHLDDHNLIRLTKPWPNNPDGMHPEVEKLHQMDEEAHNDHFRRVQEYLKGDATEEDKKELKKAFEWAHYVNQCLVLVRNHPRLIDLRNNGF
jgi:hypothetical protein